MIKLNLFANSVGKNIVGRDMIRVFWIFYDIKFLITQIADLRIFFVSDHFVNRPNIAIRMRLFGMHLNKTSLNRLSPF